MKLGFKSGLRPLIGLDVHSLKEKLRDMYCVLLVKTYKRWGKSELKKLLWWAAWPLFIEEFEDQLQEIKEVDEEAEQDLIDNYFSVAEDDDEDPRLRPRTISEEDFLTRLRKRQNPQKPIESRVIGLRGDKYGVSEPINLPMAPTSLTWNGKDVITTNQLQKLRPRRG
ncbi:hypothetical protein R3W88_004587 [Solanum pinnatisectum]|uniref:Uncharacterized protein n=1 Tax=Solanum pinnatisectum TaxID=50273 RepID=A0AAV9KBW0_9SOLN|nr:hypothetical protein R3W88_004587 [Solanum pinnatisectum]